MNHNSLRWQGTLILGLFAALMLLSLPCKSGDVENGSQRVLLEIGQEKITVADFFLYLRQINPRMDFAKLSSSDQRHWVEEFVAKKLFAKRAREAKLDQIPEVRARIEFFADSVLAQEFKNKLMREIAVDQEELAAYYRTHQDDFKLPPRVLLQHFLYKTPEKAAQAEARLRQGAAFDELAKDKKADSDVLMVEHGWFTPSLLIPELSEIAFQLPVGGTSRVLHSSYGYHVLRAEAQEPSRVKDFAEARPEILDKVRQTKAAKLYGEILDNTKNSQQVRLYLDRLQR